MKKYNFNAGPSMLPREVIENTAKQILDFNGSGLSLAEISHRAKDFQPVVDEAEALVKELLDIPEGYSVLFLGGGASLEFCMVPYNFLNKKAAYLNTGTWAKKVMKEAKLFVISGCSGVGKGTVLKEFMAKNSKDFMLSVSCTTRKPREGEVDGINYFFLTKDEFQQCIDNEKFLEWAEFAGNRYGTKKR